MVALDRVCRVVDHLELTLLVIVAVSKKYCIEGQTSLMPVRCVGRLVVWLVSWFVGWSVCHDFIKDEKVTLPFSYQSTCFYQIIFANS